MSEIKILCICGSLSQASLNKMALAAWVARLPEGTAAQTYLLHEIPPYNSDTDASHEAVSSLKEAVAAADGVMIATPEYNYGIPGVLKNALDWASRPAYKSVFAHKPVTMLGASPGPIGTARAQGQLKQVMLGMLAEIYPCPELAIGGAKAKFDEDGNVTDETLEGTLKRHAKDFVQWITTRKA